VVRGSFAEYEPASKRVDVPAGANLELHLGDVLLTYLLHPGTALYGRVRLRTGDVSSLVSPAPNHAAHGVVSVRCRPRHHVTQLEPRSGG
jgi:hypothetical protein